MSESMSDQMTEVMEDIQYIRSDVSKAMPDLLSGTTSEVISACVFEVKSDLMFLDCRSNVRINVRSDVRNLFGHGSRKVPVFF